MSKRDLITKWCKKYPDTPHLQLARMIYAAHNHVFPSVNAVRISVRRTRGVISPSVAGKYKKLAEYTGTASATRPEWRIPATMADHHTEYVVHGAQRILRLSDIHFPGHEHLHRHPLH